MKVSAVFECDEGYISLYPDNDMEKKLLGGVLCGHAGQAIAEIELDYSGSHWTHKEPEVVRLVLKRMPPPKTTDFCDKGCDAVGI